MWTASQQDVQRAPRPRQTAGGLRRTNPDSYAGLTCIKSDIQIRLIHADVNDRPSGAVKCFWKGASSSAPL